MNGAHSEVPVRIKVERVDAHGRPTGQMVVHGDHGRGLPHEMTIQLQVTVEPPPGAKPPMQRSLEILPGDRRFTLTGREAAIVGLLARGYTDGGVARELDLSKRTVSYAISGLMRRIGARNRFQLGWILSTVHSIS